VDIFFKERYRIIRKKNDWKGKLIWEKTLADVTWFVGVAISKLIKLSVRVSISCLLPTDKPQ